MARKHTPAIVIAALTGVLLLGMQLLPSSVDTAGSLRGDLDKILADARLAGAQAGLMVRDANTGEVLYDRRGEFRMQPASTAKLLTSAAALQVLGPDYRFQTSVRGDGRRSGATLNGNLYLRGGGDPTLLAKDYRRLARAVAASGVRTVRGGLVADDTAFDARRLATGWAWDDEPYYYNAQTSALTLAPDADFDSGSVIVRVTPGAPGARPKVSMTPANDYVPVVNTARTGAAGSADTLSVDRVHGRTTMRISGSIPAGADPAAEYMAVWEPTRYAASVFRAELRAAGVRVSGPTAFRATPSSARVLARHSSIPLRELLTPFLKLSNNMHAEALVKAMGRKASGSGSWEAGIAAMTEALGRLGVPADQLSLVDGSGLSRMDQVAPEQLSTLLVNARKRPWFGTWYRALPIAGEPDRLVGGTLRNRMADTPAAGNLHAKTGSYTGTTALAGYVTGRDSRRLAFAMVSNNFLGSSSGVQQLEDAVAVRLAGGSAATAPATLRRGPADERADLECSWRKAC